MILKITLTAILLVGLGGGGAWAKPRLPMTYMEPQPQCRARPPVDVDVRRSLFVTERQVVERTVSLEDVLDTLAWDSGIPDLEAIDLWDQWWDTQNASPGLGQGLNCDDMLDANGNPSINGFPVQCERNEGGEIGVDPFDPGLPSFYSPIAVVNRFDLAAPDGAHCGEYRIIFARDSGVADPFNRNLVIFEAQLPNPSPGCGIDGCQMIAEFWKQLSSIDDPVRRARMLRRFYLDGFPGRNIPAVIRVDRFAPGSGQIRTNQFMSGPNDQKWQLREFKLALFCSESDGPCALQFVPVSVKNNPFGELFDENFSDPRTIPFQRAFVNQVENLAANDLNGFFNMIAEPFNAGESSSQGVDNNYEFHFDSGSRFGRVLRQRLRQLDSPLQPDHLIRRSQAMSCAGCHQLNNAPPASDLGGGLHWPASLGFVHVSEAQTELVDGAEHFAISPALSTVFLPHREEIFEDYVSGLPCEPCRLVSLQPESWSDTGPVPIEVPLDEFGIDPLRLSPDEIRALDLERKQAFPSKTLGGSARGSH